MKITAETKSIERIQQTGKVNDYWKHAAVDRKSVSCQISFTRLPKIFPVNLGSTIPGSLFSELTIEVSARKTLERTLVTASENQDITIRPKNDPVG